LVVTRCSAGAPGNWSELDGGIFGGFFTAATRHLTLHSSYPAFRPNASGPAVMNLAESVHCGYPELADCRVASVITLTARRSGPAGQSSRERPPRGRPAERRVATVVDLAAPQVGRTPGNQRGATSAEDEKIGRPKKNPPPPPRDRCTVATRRSIIYRATSWTRPRWPLSFCPRAGGSPRTPSEGAGRAPGSRAPYYPVLGPSPLGGIRPRPPPSAGPSKGIPRPMGGVAGLPLEKSTRSGLTLNGS